ncbi:MAG: GNAT family N-acetyltransferase [Myxococcaceae bacterium]
MPQTPTARAVDVLTPGDLPALKDLLARDAAHRLFLSGVLAQHGIAPHPGSPAFYFLGERTGRSLSSVVFVGGDGELVVPAADKAADLAPLLMRHATSVRLRATFGDQDAVETVLRHWFPAAPRKQIRNQRMFVVTADDLGPFTNPALRLAREADIPRLIPMASAAAQEGLGETPWLDMSLDFAARVRHRVLDARTFVLEEAGELAFKVDLASRSDHGAELEGLYVAPAHRHRGHATLSLGQVCRQLLSKLPRLAMRIDDGHTATASVARRVGFLAQKVQRSFVSP